MRKVYSEKIGPFSNGYFEADSLLKLFRGAAAAGSETEVKRRDFKSRVFEKLRKPLDETNPDHSQADVRYMPNLSGDAGKPAFLVLYAVDKTTSTIVQVIWQIRVISLVSCSLMLGGLRH